MVIRLNKRLGDRNDPQSGGSDSERGEDVASEECIDLSKTTDDERVDAKESIHLDNSIVRATKRLSRPPLAMSAYNSMALRSLARQYNRMLDTWRSCYLPAIPALDALRAAEDTTRVVTEATSHLDYFHAEQLGSAWRTSAALAEVGHASVWSTQNSLSELVNCSPFLIAGRELSRLSELGNVSLSGLANFDSIASWVEDLSRFGQTIALEQQRIRSFVLPEVSQACFAAVLEDRIHFPALDAATSLIFRSDRRDDTSGRIPTGPPASQRTQRATSTDDSCALRYLYSQAETISSELGLTVEEFVPAAFSWIGRQSPDRLQEIVAAGPGRPLLEARSTGRTRRSPAYEPTDTARYCSAIGHRGVASLSEVEYRDELSRTTAEYDLVVDGVSQQAYRKLEDGSTLKSKLTPSQLQVIAYAMTNRKPFSPKRVLGSPSELSAMRLFCGARAKVDIHRRSSEGVEARYQFVAFNTSRQGRDGALTVRFDPPAEFKWLLLMPFPIDNSAT